MGADISRVELTVKFTVLRGCEKSRNVYAVGRWLSLSVTATIEISSAAKSSSVSCTALTNRVPLYLLSNFFAQLNKMWMCEFVWRVWGSLIPKHINPNKPNGPPRLRL